MTTLKDFKISKSSIFKKDGVLLRLSANPQDETTPTTETEVGIPTSLNLTLFRASQIELIKKMTVTLKTNLHWPDQFRLQILQMSSHDEIPRGIFSVTCKFTYEIF